MKEKTVTFPVTMKSKSFMAGASILGGGLYALALPPANLWFLIFFALLPLWYCGLVFRWKTALLCGWLWGVCWAVFSYNFLREIHPAVPYMLAPVMGLWPALFTMSASLAARRFFPEKTLTAQIRPDLPFKPLLAYLFFCAALFTVLEWTRYYLFVWNDLSVTLWKVPVLMQIARITGRYGASLFITLMNSAVFALIFSKKRWSLAGLLLIFPALSLIYGIFRMNQPEGFQNEVRWKCALIQPDLPQQRTASVEAVIRSIDLCCTLTDSLRDSEAETVFWPECAIPVPLRSNSQLGAYYRQKVAALDQQMIIGTLDFSKNSGITNGVLLISKDGKITGKYDKFHRVPFGEYVPFRKYLPESWIEKFDMGRDLTAGEVIEPLTVNENIRCGTAICYEGVFSYLSAGFARSGANVLAAVSNDVWYPESSEPEQHLANAVMRCVETGLPMIRCGNNGGSGVISSKGVFSGYIGSPADRPELLREQAAGTVEAALEKSPSLTLAVRFENALVYILILLITGSLLAVKKTDNPEEAC